MLNPNKADTGKLPYEMQGFILVSEYIFAKYGQQLTLFHTYDGKHKARSLHFKNRAIDVNLPTNNKELILSDLVFFMGKDFDVVPETDHLHIEYDPK